MKRIWWWLRINSKDLCGFLHLNGVLDMIEYCEVCGIRVWLVWWSPNELWAEITGHSTPSGDNADGIFCPRCFDNLASKQGMLLQWHPQVIHRKSAASLGVRESTP